MLVYDFAIINFKLIIEYDGAAHRDDVSLDADKERVANLKGYTVLKKPTKKRYESLSMYLNSQKFGKQYERA